MTSTNTTVRCLEARRKSLAPGAYLAIVHVSPGGAQGPIGRGVVLPEVLAHVEAIELELAQALAIPAHMQAFIDIVREALGRKSHAEICTALDMLDIELRGSR